jgi:phenylalanyl-tRNA synthetase beta chain
VKVGPSPDWLRTTLEKVGLRSINNVVDVTNFVMLECGQPLHAFDYHLVAPGAGGKPTIVVRRAREGEPFETLDGQARVLTGEMLLIADEQRGIALAGVMGGRNSEINDATTDVLIESAYFQPTSIRRTSKALGLRTDASYRFERGADPGITEWASRRCAQLILQTAGGTLAAGVVDACPQTFEPRQVTLRHHKVNELLGIRLEPGEIEFYLGQLGLKITGRKARPVEAPGDAVEPVTFRIPSWRVDLKREADLIEEVCRLHGVDKIPATPPRGAVGSNSFDSIHDDYAGIRRLLTGLGLDEAQGQTLVAEEIAALAAPAESLVRLANPLSADMNVLRPSLLPGLLDSLRHNVSRQNADLAFFEIGRVFLARDQAAPRESRRLAIALTGRRQPRCWSGEDRDAQFDAYDLKGLLEEFFDHVGLRGVVYAPRAENPPFFIESASLTLGGKVPLGEFGRLSPALARKFDLRASVFLAELDLDQVLARRNTARAFKPLPAFPTVRRDVAMLLPEATPHGAVLDVIRQTRPPHLESVELFDVFRGQNVPPGQKSLAYAFTYRAAERTLTDGEVNAAHDQVIAQLQGRLGAVIRDS